MDNLETVMEKSWKSHGKIFCQVCRNPDYLSVLKGERIYQTRLACFLLMLSRKVKGEIMYLPQEVTNHRLQPKCCSIQKDKYLFFTTRPPAVPDVFDSGRNVGALRPARRVGFRSLGAGHSRRHLPGT